MVLTFPKVTQFPKATESFKVNICDSEFICSTELDNQSRMMPSIRKQESRSGNFLTMGLKSCIGFVILTHILCLAFNQMSWLCFWFGLLVQALCAMSFDTFPNIKVKSPLFFAICGKTVFIPFLSCNNMPTLPLFCRCSRFSIPPQMGLVLCDPPRSDPDFKHINRNQLCVCVADASPSRNVLEPNQGGGHRAAVQLRRPHSAHTHPIDLRAKAIH
jgi:hypothetical protein